MKLKGEPADLAPQGVKSSNEKGKRIEKNAAISFIFAVGHYPRNHYHKPCSGRLLSKMALLGGFYRGWLSKSRIH